MLNRCHTECDCKTIDRRNQGGAFPMCCSQAARFGDFDDY
jgi:hypothetical protein